jgi:hypothetical protein
MMVDKTGLEKIGGNTPIRIKRPEDISGLLVTAAKTAYFGGLSAGSTSYEVGLRRLIV